MHHSTVSAHDLIEGQSSRSRPERQRDCEASRKIIVTSERAFSVLENRTQHFYLATRALALAIFAGAASMRILDALLPDVALTYRESIGSCAAAVSAYAISYSCCQLFYGPLGDRLGAYRVVTGAVIGSAFAASACALAPSLNWLIGTRLVAGAVAAGVGPLILAWIGERTSEAERPIAVASLTGASILGTTFGQVSGGLLGAWAGWRAGFWLVGFLFASAGAAMLLLARCQPQLLESGVPETGNHPNPERRLLGLMRYRHVWSVLLAVLVEGIAIYMSFTYIAALLRGRLALGSGGAGLLIALFGLGGIIFVISAKRIVPRLAEGTRALIGAALAAAALALLPLIRTMMSAGFVLAALGFGFFMLHNVLQVRATQMAPQSQGSATALFASAFFLAQAIGAAMGGWMLDRVGVIIPFEISAAILAILGITLFIEKRSSAVQTTQ